VYKGLNKELLTQFPAQSGKARNSVGM